MSTDTERGIELGSAVQAVMPKPDRSVLFADATSTVSIQHAGAKILEVLVRPLLDDLAVLQHGDDVGVLDGGQPVRHHHGGPVLHH
ncbi:hypothetical protein U9M48_005100 [Paspalum notatum var. saurae]|uniref:Uncharacterized protein n=1 Tax=Paspalum notatum var. saurae TaxID=547442 RepID=A0AAQ3PWS3_PASNO